MAKICHMTDAHPRHDIRIFEKECKSLSKGNDVFLVVSDGTPNEEIANIHIISTGYLPSNRIKRILFANYKVYKKAIDLDCDYYHIHDPELLFFALLLKRKNKKVIFDSHENVPGQIMSKDWIPSFVRGAISSFYKAFETFVVERIDAVVAATPYIESLFKQRARVVVNINNYPKLDDIEFQELPFDNRIGAMCYAGGISDIRGENEMLELANSMNENLIVAGPCSKEYASSKTTEYVKYVGMLDRKGINDLYSKSRLGLVLLHPTKNYLDSLPIKMFEYMAAGLPFVASNFPLWKEIAEENNCGICVNPTDINALKDACRILLDDPKKSQSMGINGRQAVVNKYNWSKEEEKLIDLYLILQ